MRLIDADKLKKHYAWWEGKMEVTKEDIDTIVDLQPTVDAVPTEFHDKCQQIEIQKRLKLEEELKEADPVKHGHWEDIDGDGSIWRCSVCGEIQCCNSNYCGDCGAKMDGQQNG